MQTMSFFEAKLVLDSEDKDCLLELLATLNHANRKAWSWARSQGQPPGR
jgi:hypothetical protein